MNAAAEIGRNPVSKRTRFTLSVEMSRLTRDRTAESVSRDQILRCERGQGNINFPVQLTTCRIGNLTRLIHTLAICVTINTYHIYIYSGVVKFCTFYMSRTLLRMCRYAAAIDAISTWLSLSLSLSYRKI